MKEDSLALRGDICNRLVALMAEFSEQLDSRGRDEWGIIVSQHLECALPRNPTEIDERREWVAKLWLGLLDVLRSNQVRASSDLSFIAEDAWEAVLNESDAQWPSPDELPYALENAIFANTVDAARASFDSNSDFRDWLELALGMCISDRLNYTYVNYAQDAQSCEVHIDHESMYPYNCLIALRHTPSSSGGLSRLRLYSSGAYDEILIPVHGAVVFNSSRTAHGRTAIGNGERLQLLSVGIIPR